MPLPEVLLCVFPVAVLCYMFAFSALLWMMDMPKMVLVRMLNDV